jgi:hypothetical protein
MVEIRQLRALGIGAGSIEKAVRSGRLHRAGTASRGLSDRPACSVDVAAAVREALWRVAPPMDG